MENRWEQKATKQGIYYCAHHTLNDFAFCSTKSLSSNCFSICMVLVSIDITAFFACHQFSTLPFDGMRNRFELFVFRCDKIEICVKNNCKLCSTKNPWKTLSSILSFCSTKLQKNENLGHELILGGKFEI